MADADGGVDGFGVHARQCPGRRRRRHRWIHLSAADGTCGRIRRGAPPPPLVGRAREREAIAAALGRCAAGRGGASCIEGEPGIGKSRLLGAPGGAAAAAGCLVLAARASEFEADLPYALWAEALDRHLAEPATAGCRGSAWRTRPRWRRPAGARARRPVAVDRHRTHRALRDLLERLAGARARSSSASTTCTGPIRRRSTRSRRWCGARPRRRCCSRVAARDGPAAGGAGRGAGGRAARGPRDQARPRAAHRGRGGASWSATRRAAIYGDSGGNPFYLEQLARGRPRRARGRGAAARRLRPAGRRRGAGRASWRRADARGAPAARRGGRRRRSVRAGRWPPRSPSLPRPAALAALDELLARGLVRPAGAPRRFAFRHPVVRHAVYVAAPGGWRLGAHARAARALERRGAGAGRARAPRRARGAARRRGGDRAARRRRARAAGARAGHGRALPRGGPAAAARPAAARERRDRAAGALADAQAAAGRRRRRRARRCSTRCARPRRRRAPRAHRRARQPGVVARRTRGRAAPAAGRARRPARRAVAGPHPPAPRARPDGAARPATSTTRARRRATRATTRARSAIRCSRPRRWPAARWRACSQRTADGAATRWTSRPRRSSGSTATQLATRLPALWMLGRARRALGRFERGARRPRARRARSPPRPAASACCCMLTVESVRDAGRARPRWPRRSRPARRASSARGSPATRACCCGRTARCSPARLAAGDVAAALRARRRGGGASRRRPDVHAAGQPGWASAPRSPRPATPSGRSRRCSTRSAAPRCRDVMPAERPAAAADLVEAQLARGDVAAAQATLAHGEAAAARAGTPWAAAVTGAPARPCCSRAGRRRGAAAAAAAARAVGGRRAAPSRARAARRGAGAGRGGRPAARDRGADRRGGARSTGSARCACATRPSRELRRLGHRVVRPARDGRGGRSAR